MNRSSSSSAANEAPQLSSDGASGVTRYRQLAGVLRHQIASGSHPVGEQLPTVEALAQTYGIAKITVRQAYALLAEEGLISSQRGRGTRVIKASAGPDDRLRAAINDPSVGANEFQIRVLEKCKNVTLPPGLLKHGKPVDSYVLVRKLHIHDGQPFSLVEMYVASETFAGFPRGSEKSHKLIHLLRQSEGDRLGEMYQTLTVEPADFALARDLSYAFGAPVARTARAILDVDDQIKMAGFAWYRGDRFILDVQVPSVLTERYPSLAIPDSRR